MPWTTPRTWTDTEVPDDTIMNAHVRDNLNAAPHLVARKTADQSVASSTTLVDVTDMVAPVAAGEVWWFAFAVLVGVSSPHFRLAFTFPGGTWQADSAWYDEVGTEQWMRWQSSYASGQYLTFGGSSLLSFLPLIKGVFINGGTAGNLQLQFTQETSNPAPLIIKTHSHIWGMKLA